MRITFLNLEPRSSVTATATQKLQRLARRFTHVDGAHLIVELEPQHQYRVVLELVVAGAPVVVRGTPARGQLADALAGAFRAAARELADRGGRRGKVVALSRGHGFGYIADETGETVFFDARIVRGGLDAVYTGARVRFIADGGEASEVEPAA